MVSSLAQMMVAPMVALKDEQLEGMWVVWTVEWKVRPSADSMAPRLVERRAAWLDPKMAGYLGASTVVMMVVKTAELMAALSVELTAVVMDSLKVA